MKIISLRSTCWSTDTLWRLLETGYKSPLFRDIDEEKSGHFGPGDLVLFLRSFVAIFYSIRPGKRTHLRVTNYTEPACRCRTNSGTGLDNRTRQCSAATSTWSRVYFHSIIHNKKILYWCFNHLLVVCVYLWNYLYITYFPKCICRRIWMDIWMDGYEYFTLLLLCKLGLQFIFPLNICNTWTKYLQLDHSDFQTKRV